MIAVGQPPVGKGRTTCNPQESLNAVWPITSGFPRKSSSSARVLTGYGMAVKQLLKEIRHNPLLWLLALVPVVFAPRSSSPKRTRCSSCCPVLAIVPLATLLQPRHGNPWPAKTGDAVGGLLNATLGNLTRAGHRAHRLSAGECMLVKASVAGAIVTNTLFMLGASFCSADSNITCRNTTGSAPACKRACSSWPRSRC